MKPTRRELDTLLDRTLAEMRAETPDPAAAEAAAERARRRLGGPAGAAAEAAGPIAGCGGFRALIPDYVAGRLPPSRALLLEDHGRECVPCRRALKAARVKAAEPAAVDATAARRSSTAARRYLAAAAAVLAAVAGVWILLEVVPVLSWGQEVRVEALEGDLFQATPQGFLPLAPGAEVAYGESLRAAKGSRAVVRLEDGSRLELGERAEIAVERRGSGTTVHLGQGNLIVEAAKRRHGKLFVATEDCLVAVKGTIFSVSHGVKGSRVSVIEGAVEVDTGRREALLRPGQQLTTRAAVTAVPVARDIAWSRKVDEYLALLGELQTLRRDLSQTLAAGGELHHSTRLLDLAPAETAVYVSIPNVSRQLSRAYQVLAERVAANPDLARWWSEEMGGEERARLEEVIRHLADFGDYLGPEVVVTVLFDPGAEAGGGEEPFRGFLVLAEVVRPGLDAFLEQEIRNLGQGREGHPRPRLIDDPATASQVGEGVPELLVWLRGDLLVAGFEPRQLRAVAARLEDPAAAGGLADPLRARLAAAYGEGAGWLLGADMGAILRHARRAEDGPGAAALERLGVADLSTLVLEREHGDGDHVHQRAELAFDGPRRGLASWLAPPAPMGSLDFISPDAHLAVAFLLEEPRALVADLFAMVDPESPELRRHLEEFEARHGLSLEEDFAAPLGGEFAFALDGPALPRPAWKVVAEVYDSARLQNTLARLVEQWNQQAADSGEALLTLEPREVAGFAGFRLASDSLPGEVHYLFADGYLVAAPQRALLERALQYRDSGYNLPRSAHFTALLPADGHLNFSGVAYQNLGSLLAPLAERWSAAAGGLTPEQRQRLETILAETPSTLACAYGGEDAIEIASTSEGGFFAGLLGAGGVFGLRGTLEELLDAAPEGAAPPEV